MSGLKDDAFMLAAGLGVLLLAGWYLSSKAADIVQAAPGVIADTAAAAVVGTGEILGIPPTNETKCDEALRLGNKLEASFQCPAGRFIRSVFD